MKYFTINKNIHFIPLLAFLFCIYFLFAPEKYKLNPLSMNFIYAVSISIIAAYIFYIFNIYLPEKKGRILLNIILKNNIFILKKNVFIYFYLL